MWRWDITPVRPPRLSSKGIAVFVTVLLLGVLSVAGIIGSVVTVSTDGYRRQPKEQFARTA